MRPRPAWNETNTKSLQVPISQTKKVQSYKVIVLVLGTSCDNLHHWSKNMNSIWHWKILSVRPLLQISAFLRPSDTKRISTCRCQQRSETSQEIERSQTSWSLQFHPRFCGCWSRTRIHSSEFPSMTHVSDMCVLCKRELYKKKPGNRRHEYLPIWKYDNIS